MNLNLKNIRSIIKSKGEGQFYKGASAVLIIHVASVGLVMLVNILAGRMLGPSNYGIYSFSLSSVMLVSMFSQFGMNTVITRKVSAYNANSEPHLRNRFLGFVFALATGLSLSFALVAFLLLQQRADGQMEPVLYSTLVVGCLVVPLFALNPLLSGVIRGSKKVIPAYIFMEFLRPALLLCVLVGFYFAGQQLGPELMLTLNAMALSLGVIGSFIYIKKKLRVDMVFRAREENRLEWGKMSLQFLAIGLLAKMIFEAGTVIIGVFVGTTEAGYFFMASRIASLLTFVLYATNGVLGPMISEQYEKKDTEGMERLYRLSLRFSIVISSILAVGIVVGGKWILSLFGEGFIVAYPLLIVLTVGQLGNAFVGSTGLILNMTGNQGLAIRILLVSGPSSLILLILGSIYFGSMGAAIAVAALNILTNITFAFFVWKRVNIVPLPFKLKT